MADKHKLTLSQCSKADLVWLIKRILQMTDPFNQDYRLSRALSDLNYEKEKQRIDEAKKYGKIADEKRREYIALLTQYNGKPLKEIPLAVLDKIDKLQKEAQAADKKYAALMGLEG